MAIGVDGNFAISFSLDELEDFIEAGELVEFAIEESAGNKLPQFDWVFNTRNDRIFAYLNEGNPISVSFGKDSETARTTTLVASSVQTMTPTGNQTQTIKVKGLYNAPEYFNGARMNIYSQKKSVEAIAEVASRHFFTDALTENDLPSWTELRTEDRMNWVQPYLTDRTFIDDVWRKCFLPDSFIGCGIDSFGTFFLKDMKSDQGEPLWNFTHYKANSSTDIVFDDTYTLKGMSGLINNLIGYGASLTVMGMESSDETIVTEKATPILALTDSLDQKDSIQPNQLSSRLQSKNVHKNYWRAEMRNKALLGQFSNIGVQISFQGVFKNVKVLDLVHLRVDRPGSRSQDDSSEFISGLYFVYSVTRRILNNQLTTTVLLCRESLNQLEGPLVPPEEELVEPTSELTPEESEEAGLEEELE